MNTQIAEPPRAEKRYNVTDIAKDVRLDLKHEFPQCKFSVTIEKYSMGQSMTVALMEAPFEVFASDVDSNGHKQDKEYTQLNHFQFHRGDWHEKRVSNCTILTEPAWNTLAKAVKIANRENWDNSEPQTDYCDVNYHFSLHVGKWNKPFVVVGKLQHTPMTVENSLRRIDDLQAARQ